MPSTAAARLRSHARIPLYRSAYALTASGIAAAGLGLVFWAAASRLYSADAVGLSSAAVAALMLVSGIAGLYLDGVLYRFLPRAGRSTGRLLIASSALTVASAAVVGGVFVAGIDLWAPALSFGRWSPWAALISVAAVVTACLLVLQDAAFVALRRAGWVPIKNAVFGVCKLALVIAFAGAIPRYGILVAWIAPMFLIGVAFTCVVGRLVPQHVRAVRDAEPVNSRGVASYAVGNYGGFLCTLAYRNIPPILVLHQAGPEAAAYFYPPWLITSSVLLFTTNLSVSLVVEGSFDRARLRTYALQALRQTARIVWPVALILCAGAGLVLQIFGPEYSERGLNLLRLLALGLIPASICVLSFGLARVQDHVRSLVVNQVVLAGLVLGLSAALVPRHGIAGVGVAWVVAQTAVAAFLLVTELRPALRRPPRRSRATTPEPTPAAPVRNVSPGRDLASHELARRLRGDGPNGSL